MTEEVKSASEQKKEDWMNSKWRPMMGWMYMVVCTCDFVLFPVLWSLTQAILKAGQITQWNPLTLQGAGLFHIAMGAVLGLAAFGRTQEKIAGANNGGANLPSSGFTTPSTPPTGGFQSTTNFGSPTSTPPASSFGGGGFGGTPQSTTSFGGNPSTGATAVGSTAPAVVTGWGGKPAPVQPEQPQI